MSIYKHFLRLLMIATVGVSVFAVPSLAAGELEFLSCESISGLFVSDDPVEREEAAAEACDNRELSFTDFRGGFAPPDSGDFATLSRAKSVREFVLNVLNFVLTFLGLVAIVVIIYGGFRYITAGGEEDGTTAGKKSILYAVLGLVIVMGSFAIVNTVIESTGGPAAGIDAPLTIGERVPGELLSGAAGGSFAQNERFFGLTVRIRRTTVNFSQSFLKFTEIQTFLDRVKNEIGTVQGVLDPADAAVSRSQVKAWAQNVRPAFLEIKSKANAFTDVRIAIDQYLEEVIDPIVRGSDDSLNIFQNKAPDLIGEITEKHIADFKREIEKFAQEFAAIRSDIGIIAAPGTGSPISQAFDAIIGPRLELASAGADVVLAQFYQHLETAHTDPTQFRTVLQTIVAMHSRIFELNAVSAVVRADSIEGSSPFIVNFDGLGSHDPSNISIQPAQYEWDLDGDGVSGEEIADAEKTKNCAELGPTPTCTYLHPGTYRVALRVNSTEQENVDGVPFHHLIAPGVAYITIHVFPPASQINLTVKAGERDPEPVRQYDDGGNLVADQDRVKITLSEAQAGITFDATKSKGGAGSEIAKAEWDFGDNTQSIQGADEASRRPTHSYGAKGVYKVTLVVSDTRGIVDRKIFNVYVGSPSVRIMTPILRGTTETVFEFDGTFSKSDFGQITAYEWTIPGVDDLESPTEPVFRHRFTKPGRFEIFLTATDNGGNQDRDSVVVLVESKKPTADFEARFPDPRHPGTVYLDASGSFDPDPGDTLSYSWDIKGAIENVDYEKLPPPSEEESDEILVLKFKKRGRFEVQLTVADQHPEESLRQSHSVEKTVEVRSAIDLSWDENQEDAVQLNEEGEAPLDFLAHTENADFYEVNFGDGETVENNVDGETVEFSHTYAQSGSYLVTLDLASEGGDRNGIKRRVHIANAESPQAVLQISVNDVPVDDLEDFPEITRADRVTLDARNSLNVDGSYRNLNYSWNFGDGKAETRSKTDHVFQELSPEDPGHFTATLTISDAGRGGKKSSISVDIPVVSAVPKAGHLTVTSFSADRITPFNARVKVVGAKDPDGEINEYRFWYYDALEPSNELGVAISSTPETELLIGTKGNQGEVNDLVFCVALKDNENNFVSCDDLIAEVRRPHIKATNGPNDAPMSAFSVDKTTVQVSEQITFTSSSSDPDGKIVKHIWDIHGDGSFANDDEHDQGTATFRYDKPSPRDGFSVRLKVFDDKGSSSVSDAITIFVESAAQPPTANFNFQINDDGSVQFESLSRADTGGGAILARHEWDFDEQFDSNGDRNPKNDTDSSESDPVHVYPGSGQFMARLTVVDNFYETATIRKPVIITSSIGLPATGGGAVGGAAGGAVGGAAGGAAGGAVGGIVATPGLRAVLESVPPVHSDGVIYLTPGASEAFIEFSFDKSSGNIVEYRIDKNIYYDTNSGEPGTLGDGVRNNDVDYRSATPTRFRTNYLPEWHPIAVKLTVTDRQGHESFDLKRIVFSTPPQAVATAATFNAAAFFNSVGGGSLQIFAFLLLFVIVAAGFYYILYGRGE